MSDKRDPNTQKRKISDTASSEECFSAPQVERHPANKQIRLGEKLVLQVTATGIPLPTYQWFQNGKKLSGATNNRIVIHHTRHEHSGQYHCEMKNFIGATISRAASVSFFREKSFELVIEPESIETMEGGECFFQMTSPELKLLKGYKLQWFLNEKKVAGADRPKLKFININQGFTGEYTLVATNKAGDVRTSNKVNLKVNKKPELKKVEEAPPLIAAKSSAFFDPNDFTRTTGIDVSEIRAEQAKLKKDENKKAS